MEEAGNNGFIKWFSKIDKSMAPLVGFKGAYLGELFSNHLPVPDGFVVTSEAYLNFISSSGIKEKIDELLESSKMIYDESFLDSLSQIKNMIMNSEFPEELKEDIIDSYQALGTDKIEVGKGSARDILNSASEPVFASVRNSLCFRTSKENPTREQDTYLNVKGNDEILEHVKSCFASLFSPETIRREVSNNVKASDLRIAVVIQKMINAEKSGFVISRDSSRSMSVYSIWGIGEGMNLEEVVPDKCVLARDLSITEKKKGEKNFYVARSASGILKKVPSSEERKNSEVLNNYELQRIGDLAEKIESHFGIPQKVEFAIDESGIHILQSEDLKEKPGEPAKDMENSHFNSIYNEVHSVGKVDLATRTKLKLIIDSPFLVEEGVATGLKKVGLMKIEKITEKSGKHPLYFEESNYINEYENMVYDGIKLVARNFDEVIVRTSDFLSDEVSGLEGVKIQKEKNPLLGLHGIRFGLRHPDILEAELRAVKRAAADFDVGILLPNIISVAELREVRKILEKIGFENANTGIVIETPAAVQLIKDFCDEKIDSILINSGRLLEYLLASDAGNEEVSNLMDETNPAFLYQLEYVMRVAKRNNIETGLFGSALGNDEILKYLIRKNIDSVSVEPSDAKKISEKIDSFEKELVHGTDSEPRKYEMEKGKEEYLKESGKPAKV